MNKVTVFLVIGVLLSINSIAQDTIRVNDTIVRIISNRSEAIPDSLVKPDYEKVNEYSAIPLKSNNEISKEVSFLFKAKSFKRYEDIRGESLLYTVKTDKKGNITYIKWFRDFKHRLFFDKYIVSYLKKLIMKPAHKQVNGKRININSSRVLQIAII
jgi:hypothetical protein